MLPMRALATHKITKRVGLALAIKVTVITVVHVLGFGEVVDVMLDGTTEGIKATVETILE